jgi:hypothetical protein
MFIPYNKIDDNSRVWIYQSNKSFSSKQKSIIEDYLTELCSKWQTHGKAIHSSFLLNDWFICLFVDESKNSASGCSIDSSVAMIKKIEQEFQLDFFNRLNIAFLDENGDTKVLPLSKFKNQAKDNLKVYNNLVKTKRELELNWIIPLEESWLVKYFN